VTERPGGEDAHRAPVSGAALWENRADRMNARIAERIEPRPRLAVAVGARAGDAGSAVRRAEALSLVHAGLVPLPSAARRQGAAEIGHTAGALRRILERARRRVQGQPDAAHRVRAAVRVSDVDSGARRWITAILGAAVHVIDLDGEGMDANADAAIGGAYVVIVALRRGLTRHDSAGRGHGRGRRHHAARCSGRRLDPRSAALPAPLGHFVRAQDRGAP